MLGVARSGAASTAEKTPHRETLSGRRLGTTTIEVLIYCVQLHVARLLSAYCTSITHAFGIAFARCLGSCLPPFDPSSQSDPHVVTVVAGTLLAISPNALGAPNINTTCFPSLSPTAYCTSRLTCTPPTERIFWPIKRTRTFHIPPPTTHHVLREEGSTLWRW